MAEIAATPRSLQSRAVQWLLQHQRKLLVIEGLSVCTGVVCLGYTRAYGSSAVNSTQLRCWILPWVVLLIVGLPLVYLSWFARPSASRWSHVAKQVAFWFGACIGISV